MAYSRQRSEAQNFESRQAQTDQIPPGTDKKTRMETGVITKGTEVTSNFVDTSETGVEEKGNDHQRSQPYEHQPSTVYPIGQPSRPAVYTLGASHTAPMPGITRYHTPSFEPRIRERKIIQIKDPNSDKDVTQEILNRQPSWSPTDTTSGTLKTITPNMTVQSSSSSTPPLTSQEQAEANVRAQFAAQVAALLANNIEDKPKKSEYTVDKPSAIKKRGMETVVKTKVANVSSNSVDTSETGLEDKGRDHQRSEPQGFYGYQSSTVYQMEQPSSPMNILGASHTAPMPGITRYHTPSFEPRIRERKIIQIKDPNSDKDVTQEILNRQPSWSPTDKTRGTSNSVTQSMSGQGRSLSPPPLTSQEQAEANVRAQFAAQIAATLVNNTEDRPKKPEYTVHKPSAIKKRGMETVTKVSSNSVDTSETGLEDKGNDHQRTQLHGLYGYQPSTIYPMEHPSSPVYILGASPSTPMAEMTQYQTTPFEPRTRERKIIQIKDPNSDKDVTQEILNQQPSGSLTGSTSGTSTNMTRNMSGQSSSSSTPILTSQQQAEANVRAQFAAQVAATLVDNTEDKPKKPEYTVLKPPANKKKGMETFDKSLVTEASSNSVDTSETALWSPALDEVSDLRPEGQKVITYERDFLLQLQSIPTCLLRPEGLPDYECVLGNKQTPSKPEMEKLNGVENIFLPASTRLQFSVEDAEIRKMNSGEVNLWSSEASNGPIDSLASVPPEILARGRLAIGAYNKALREGKTLVKRLPVMLIGQDRSGKTSLKKSLRGEHFNPNEKSTVGIDKDPSHFQVTTELWKAGVKDRVADSTAATSYEHHAAKLIVNSLTEEQTPTEESLEPLLLESPSLPSADTAEVEGVTTTEFLSCQKHVETNLEHMQYRALPTGGSRSSVPSHEDASEPPDAAISCDSTTTDVQDVKTLDGPRVNSSSLSDESEVPQDIASLVAKLLHKGTKAEDDDIYSVLWDFGGQSVYYATHPLFLTPRAIYVLVYDLSRDPCERADPPLKQGMFKPFKDQFSLKTHLDYLYFWMTSVSSLACQAKDGEILLGPNCDVLPERLPPVFLVCSHADKPYDEKDPNTLATDIFDSLQRNPYSSHLVETVFVVDNTLSGSELECPEVVRLRRHILAVAKELPQMKELIPIKWLKYEKALHLTKKEGHKWISLESAKQIAFEACKIPDDQEFLTLLNFLHDQRIVIHFDDTPRLENFVVLDPQWLIDVFSKVITVKPYAHEERKFKELWRKLEATGVLEEDLLKHVWGPLLSQTETSESLIAIMEKFSLLCPWPTSAVSSTKQYLVPSMLMSHPPQDIINLVSSSQLPSLFVKFQSGQVPPGLFPRLMLQFFQWGKEEFWSRANPHLFRNFARFYTSGDEDCSVVLLCHSSSVEVIVHRGNRGIESAKCLQSKVNVSSDAHHDGFEVACACTVQRQLCLMLESMRKEFCWLRNMRYEVGVICPVCCQGGVLNYCRDHHTQDCERGDCLHFLSESELRSAKQSIICTRSAAATNNKVYVKQFALWFECPKEQYSQQPVVKCGGRPLPSSIGNEHKSVALPRKAVTELLSWKSTDPKEIVLQLEKSFQVDQSSLEQPGTETKKLIRYVASKAKRLDRLDVVEHLRKITPAGTTGPLLPGELDVRNIPVGRMRELTVDLSGGDEWKEVAERLGLSPKEIRYLDKRTMNPFDAVLAYISQQRYYINVDDLYDVLNECGLPVLADLL